MNDLEKMRERRDACFEFAKNFGQATFERDDGANAELSRLCRRYADSFSMKSKWLVLSGACGVGKSYAAACIANELISRHSVLFLTIPDIERMMWRDKNETHKMLMDASLLIIDDFGTERKTEFVNELKFSIIDGRLRSGKPCVITTNLGLNDFASPPSLQDCRVISRIFEKSIFYEVKGSDRRFEKLRKTSRAALDELLKEN